MNKEEIVLNYIYIKLNIKYKRRPKLYSPPWSLYRNIY